LKRIRDSRQEHNIIEFLDVDVLPEPRIDIFCLSNVLDIPLPQEEIESAALGRNRNLLKACALKKLSVHRCILFAVFFSKLIHGLCA
jgi:hypothetical protein